MNKKIFITLFVFIGFLFFFNCSNVFASYEVDFADDKHTLPDLPIDDTNKYYILFGYKYGGEDVFELFVCSEPFKWIQFYKGYYMGIYSSSYKLGTTFLADDSLNSDVPLLYKYQFVNGKDNAWVFQNSHCGFAYISKDVTAYGILGCNNSQNIYLGDFVKNSNGIYEFNQNELDPVFQAAPQEEEPAPTPISTLQVAPTLTSTDLSGILAQILAILPVVLTVLISLLALRKAIHLLLKILGQA